MSEPPAEQPAEQPAEAVQPLLSVRDVAKLLGVTTKTIRRWTSDGRFPAPVTIGKLLRWTPEAVEEVLAVGVARDNPEAGARMKLPVDLRFNCPCCSARLKYNRSGKVEALGEP